jgi:hypothetical protein
LNARKPLSSAFLHHVRYLESAIVVLNIVRFISKRCPPLYIREIGGVRDEAMVTSLSILAFEKLYVCLNGYYCVRHSGAFVH